MPRKLLDSLRARVILIPPKKMWRSHSNFRGGAEGVPALCVPIVSILRTAGAVIYDLYVLGPLGAVGALFSRAGWRSLPPRHAGVDRLAERSEGTREAGKGGHVGGVLFIDAKRR